ncbi:MAG: hypothetical protein ACI9P5_003621 [Saprospiraceae bacterium]|jgi:hypothetical protein
MVKTYFINSKRKWCMLSTALIFALSILSFTNVSAQALACNDNVQVSLNQNCEADITPGMILEGEDEDLIDNYSVTIGGVTGTIITVPGVYSVTITDSTNGNSCWGAITVEDKLAPAITGCDCPPGNDDPECQFLCTDLDNVLSNSIPVPQPEVEENCGSYVSEYTDQIVDGGCGEKVITRTWLFTDNSGNTANGCTQEFRTLAVSLADIVPPVNPIELGCGADISMPAIVNYFTPIVGASVALTYGYPTANGVAINGAICNLVASKVDLEIPVCDQSCSNSFKVIRDWTVLDWCTAEITNYTQIIKAVDNEAPTVQAQDMTVSTSPWVCEANFYLQAPSILHDDCTSFVDYTVSGPAGVTITYDSQFDLYYVSNLPKGVHTFVYTASDCCDNTAQDPILVTVKDKTAPVAIAKQNIVISLTQAANGQGSAKLYAPSIDNGSHDGCTGVKLEIRRDNDECNVNGNATYNNDGHTFDSNNDTDDGKWVKFCCEDLTNVEVDIDGDGVLDPGYVKVWMRVWDDGDMNGTFGSTGDNFNETWAFVKVEDKLNPSIQCPPDVVISCDDDADDLSLTGTATGSFTCAGATVVFNDIVNNVNTCGVGNIVRRWSIEAHPQIFCDQQITKSAGDLFDGDITWPNDFTTDCTDTDGNDNIPTWSSPGCSLVGYNVASDTFQFEDGACFKIINEWTVIDWCQYDPNATNPEGIWSHIQIIKVLDDEAPIMTCANQMYAVNDNQDADNDGNKCEIKSLMLTNTADDNGDCSSKWLKWTVLVDVWGDGTYDYEFSSNLPTFDSNFNDTNGNGIGDIYLAPTSSGEEVKVTLPDDIQGSMSNHKVKWSVSDGCQNITSCENTFMVVDKKAPTPYCIDISTALMESGMVEIWACDFDLGSFDNCTSSEDLRFTFTSTPPQSDPSFNDETGCSSKIFDCDDLTDSTVTVTMYVWDEKGNSDFCDVELTLVDNQGGCDTTDGMRIAGSVSTPDNKVINDIEVVLQAPSIEITKFDNTNEEGDYAFNNNPALATYSIAPTKNDNFLDGVSTLDLVKIQRHILGLADLNDAYKIIAADINNDEYIGAADLLQLRKLILGVITELPSNTSYVMVDAAQEFSDINDPWPLHTDIIISPLETHMNDQNFVAIKVGDVTNNATYGLTQTANSEVRSSKTLSLSIDNQMLVKNEVTSINVNATNTKSVLGLQFALNIEGLDNVTLTSGALNITEANYRMEGSEIKFSWSAAQAMNLIAEEALFSIDGIATKAISTDEVITLNNRSTVSSEAYGADLEIMDLAIASRDLASISVFEVSQNEPNPFGDVTSIAYNLSEAGKVSLSITDVNGKVVFKTSTDAPMGEGQFAIEASNLNQSGVYYYTVTSGDHSVTNKMILIK